MVRVLHYIGLLEFGGSQSFVMEIYRKIDKTQLQFDFVTFPNQKEKGFYDEIINLGGRVFEAPQYNGKNHLDFVKWWKNFFEVHEEYSIFHVHVRSVGCICIDIAHQHDVFCVAHSHSTSNGNGIRATIKNMMQYFIHYKADYMFACSEIAGRWLFGKNVDKKNNYRVISNAIDAQRFNYDESKRLEVRKALYLEDKFVVGHVGRMTEPKNHIFLIKVFSAVCKHREDARLLLIGDGELRDMIVDEIRKNKIEDKVLILGSKNNTEDYYQAMDVFIFPSLWEGLGIAAIEAQTAGLPCIVSEKIPQEAILDKELVKVMKLSDEPRLWGEAIVNSQIDSRSGRVELIRNAGYDVTQNAIIMQKFYIDVAEKEGNKRVCI